MSTQAQDSPLIWIGEEGVITDHTEEEIAFFQGWQPTCVMESKDDAESEYVAKRIKAATSQCWFNARKAIRKLPDYATASYVEGWAMVQGVMPIEHGWIVQGTTVIDPTLPHYKVEYFPGLEFIGQVGIEEFLKTNLGKRCRKSPFFFAFGWGGMCSPTFRKAWASCNERLLERANIK